MKVSDRLTIGLFLFLLVFLLKLPVVNTPPHWDGLLEFKDAAKHVQEGIDINLRRPSFRHPPFFPTVNRVLFKVFGAEPWVSHSMTMVFSFVAVYFTYLIGRHIFDSETAIIASLILLFSPLYFAQSGLMLVGIPFTALGLMTIYYGITRRYKTYVICATLLILTKEPGIILVLIMALYLGVNMEKRDVKKLTLISLPVAVFLVWLLFSITRFGWFVHPDAVGLFLIQATNAFINFFYRIFQLAFLNYKWLLTTAIIMASFDFRNKKIDNKVFLPAVVIAVLCFILLANTSIVLPKILHTLSVNMSSADIARKADILHSFRFLFAFYILFTLSFLRRFRYEKWLSRDMLILVTIILAYSVFYSFMADVYLLRYLLVAYPLFFIISANALKELFGRYASIPALVMILIFVSQWTGQSSTCGSCEENLQYLDIVDTHLRAANFIEENYPDAVILTTWPQTDELKRVYYGYVTKQIKVKLAQDDPDLSDVSLVYYSPQSYRVESLETIMGQMNLTLLERFEKSGKFAEVYGVL